MYAIFQSGGKQHKVSEGQTISVEKLNFKTGENIKFDKILMIVNCDEINIGNPFISQSIIQAEVISHVRNKKIKIVKFNRRKHYRKQQGHRQWCTNVKITSINVKQ